MDKQGGAPSRARAAPPLAKQDAQDDVGSCQRPVALGYFSKAEERDGSPRISSFGSPLSLGDAEPSSFKRLTPLDDSDSVDQARLSAEVEVRKDGSEFLEDLLQEEEARCSALGISPNRKRSVQSMPTGRPGILMDPDVRESSYASDENMIRETPPPPILANRLSFKPVEADFSRAVTPSRIRQLRSQRVMSPALSSTPVPSPAGPLPSTVAFSTPTLRPCTSPRSNFNDMVGEWNVDVLGTHDGSATSKSKYSERVVHDGCKVFIYSIIFLVCGAALNVLLAQETRWWVYSPSPTPSPLGLASQHSQKEEKFSVPLEQTILMFVGEALCLVALMLWRLWVWMRGGCGSNGIDIDLETPLLSGHTTPSGSPRSSPLNVGHRLRQDGNHTTEQWSRRPCLRCCAFLLPALCDLSASLLLNYAVVVVEAEFEYQLLRVLLLIFTAILSVCFNRRHFRPSNWIGLMFVITGTVVAAVPTLVTDSTKSLVVTGMLYLVGSFVLNSLQFVIEERLLHDHECDPIEMVGFEGIWGLLLSIVLYVVLVGVQSSGVSGTMFYNIFVGDRTDLFYIFLHVLIVAVFNAISLLLMYETSAVFRATLDYSRITTIFLLNLVGYNVCNAVHSADCASVWSMNTNKLSWIMCIGFGAVTVGTLLFHWLPNRCSPERSQPPGRQRVFTGTENEWLIDMKDISFGKVIGRGACGMVYRGMWRGGIIAVKVVNPSMLDDESQLPGDLGKETFFMSRLHHPHVVRFIGVCNAFPYVAICTEYMERGSVHDVLHSEQRLPWLTRLQMGIDAASGVLFLHENQPPIIHRDLKTRNLLVDERYRVKVGDFGLSSLQTQDGTQTFTCTPFYAAPEVLNRQSFSEKSDAFAFGIVLWELYTMKEPYSGMNPLEVGPAVAQRGLRPAIPDDCPDALVRLLGRCWSTNPAERPEFSEIIADMTAMQHDQRIRAERLTLKRVTQ